MALVVGGGSTRSMAAATSSVSSALPALPRSKRINALGRSALKPLRLVVARAADEGVEVELKETLPSGEWPENFSMLNYEDLIKHFEPSLFKAEAQPSTFLADVMSKDLVTASPDTLLEEVDHNFAKLSGLPIVDKDFHCVGVLSKKDRAKASKGLKSPIKEVMSSPAITLSADKTVSDAAVLMLKNKIHRIPIVNKTNQVIGIVTRTDIFTAMQGSS